jgi:hypothetical protein
VTRRLGSDPIRRLVASAVVVLVGLAACSGSESELPIRLDGPTTSFPGFIPPEDRAPCPGAVDPATLTVAGGAQAETSSNASEPREITLTSSDGAEVPALVVAGTNGAGVVLVHGGFGRRP